MLLGSISNTNTVPFIDLNYTFFCKKTSKWSNSKNAFIFKIFFVLETSYVQTKLFKISVCYLYCKGSSYCCSSLRLIVLLIAPVGVSLF